MINVFLHRRVGQAFEKMTININKLGENSYHLFVRCGRHSKQQACLMLQKKSLEKNN